MVSWGYLGLQEILVAPKSQSLGRKIVKRTLIRIILWCKIFLIVTMAAAA
jgi:hypothetical protein